MMVSYAQNLEDVMLARAFRGQREGFYVDVGALHPEFHSVTKHFYDRGWCGINVEPVKAHWSRFVAERPRDLNLNVALGSAPARATLLRVGDTGLSSLAPEARTRAQELGESVSEEEVEVTTLAAICERHAKREIDFLKIDVEGFEADVIRGADWSRFRPKIVVVEATVPGTQIENFEAWEGELTAAGYEFAWFDGLNRFYVREESRELLACFRVPPNVFDEWISASEQALKRRLKKERKLKSRVRRFLGLGSRAGG